MASLSFPCSVDHPSAGDLVVLTLLVFWNSEKLVLPRDWGEVG